MRAFVDTEYFNDRVFLLGIHRGRQYIPLYGRSLSRRRVVQELDGIKEIFCWGPDVGRLENEFGIKLKRRYRCVNLMTVCGRLDLPRGLKPCVEELGIDLPWPNTWNGERVDGRLAQILWRRWEETAEVEARDMVIRYNRLDCLSLNEICRVLRRDHNLKMRDFVNLGLLRPPAPEQ